MDTHIEFQLNLLCAFWGTLKVLPHLVMVAILDPGSQYLPYILWKNEKTNTWECRLQQFWTAL